VNSRGDAADAKNYFSRIDIESQRQGGTLAPRHLAAMPLREQCVRSGPEGAVRADAFGSLSTIQLDNWPKREHDLM